MASFKIWALQVITEKGSLKRIRSDHGGEFQNEVMTKFCNEQGIAHQFSAPRTPQMNGVVERKNRTLQGNGESNDPWRKHSCESHEIHLEALEDADWIISMEEELEEFVRNDVWELCHYLMV
ncbi:unnamed protein product [Microthlaspi erraticum]|uniref:Integrase catalytic domain-containing protein n=1 Tax=Microthlaspi erraticum TaxID=1685480 RepID=A0A6D2JDP4_9BRAS|nr:unnamed protein product [Microthlaspi erraticum]